MNCIFNSNLRVQYSTEYCIVDCLNCKVLKCVHQQQHMNRAEIDDKELMQLKWEMRPERALVHYCTRITYIGKPQGI